MTTHWKEKYDNLCAAIQEIHETANVFMEGNKNIPDEPISDSKEFFVSNVLGCVDNEEYAIENWGEGKYFKVKKCITDGQQL